jgi:hypothetical protein
MTILGTELEDANNELAERLISKYGWTPGRHRPPASERTHKYSRYFDPKLDHNEFATCFTTSCVGENSLTRLIDLLTNVSKAKADDEKLMHVVPTSTSGIHQFLSEQFGYVPYFLQMLKAAEVKRGLTYATWSMLLADAENVQEQKGKPCMPSNDKIVLAYVYFTSAENGYMAAQMATLAHRRGIPAFKLQNTLETAEQFSPVSPENSFFDPITMTGRTFFQHAAMVTWLSARRQNIDMYLLTDQLLPLSNNNFQQVMELLALNGLCSCLQRLTSALVTDDKLEEPVKAIIYSDYGKSLDLPVRELSGSTTTYHSEDTMYAWTQNNSQVPGAGRASSSWVRTGMPQVHYGGGEGGAAKKHDPMPGSDDSLVSISDANEETPEMVWGGHVRY